MVLKKSDIGKLSNDELAAVTRLENELIDPHLNTDFNAKSGAAYVVFEYHQLKQVLGFEPDHRIVAEIQRRYREAGWKVEDHHDQRDGAFLQFR